MTERSLAISLLWQHCSKDVCTFGCYSVLHALNCYLYSAFKLFSFFFFETCFGHRLHCVSIFSFPASGVLRDIYEIKAVGITWYTARAHTQCVAWSVIIVLCNTNRGISSCHLWRAAAVQTANIVLLNIWRCIDSLVCVRARVLLTR